MIITLMNVIVTVFIKPSNKDYVYVRKVNTNTIYIGKYNEVLLLLK